MINLRTSVHLQSAVRARTSIFSVPQGPAHWYLKWIILLALGLATPMLQGITYTEISQLNSNYTIGSSLLLGMDGNFYGQANNPKTNGNSGIVFKVTPTGLFTTLATFHGTNGAGAWNNTLVQ